MKEIRIVYSEAVNEMCKKYNYYKNGSIEEYENMLNYIDKINNLTSNKAIKIAENIKKYSETKDNIRDIATYIINECTYTIIIDI